MNKETMKLLAISAGVFGIVVAANIVAKAVYTNSKLGIDKKALLIAGIGGVGLSFVVMKYYKKSA
jgi:hypothetical protein